MKKETNVLREFVKKESLGGQMDHAKFVMTLWSQVEREIHVNTQYVNLMKLLQKMEYARYVNIQSLMKNKRHVFSPNVMEEKGYWWMEHVRNVLHIREFIMI